MKKIMHLNKKNLIPHYGKISLFVILLLVVNDKAHSQQVKQKEQKQLSERQTARTGLKNGPTHIPLSALQQKPVTPGMNDQEIKLEARYPMVKQINNQSRTEPVRYIFNGNGQWKDAANWKDGIVPPSKLQNADKVIICGKSHCLFNNVELFFLEGESSIDIEKGATLYVSMGRNMIVRGGTITNDGTLTVLSGRLSQQQISPAVINHGEFADDMVSKKIDGQQKPTQGLPNRFNQLKAN